MDPEKLQKSTTTNGRPPEAGLEHAGAPAPIDLATGQHKAYWVLSEQERAKGFVRPVRRAYIHVGQRPKYPLRDLTEEEWARYQFVRPPYVAFEAYPASESSITGRFWTQAQLQSGCGTVTTMGQAIAETYARDPTYYGSTFCVACGAHFPVGPEGEFVWDDAGRTKVGT